MERIIGEPIPQLMIKSTYSEFNDIHETDSSLSLKSFNKNNNIIQNNRIACFEWDDDNSKCTK